MIPQYGNIRFSEAISFFREKLDIPTERWADIWQQHHNHAFTVAGATKTALLADLREIVDGAIANGTSLNRFKSQFNSLVKQHGWDHTGSRAFRANIIYTTNVRQSYNAGRYRQLQNFPFWRYQHGDSRFPRPTHLAQDGRVLPKDSPWWNSWFPQNGWGCKCRVFGETQASVERKGLKVSDEPAIETREWEDKVTGEIHNVPVGIDPGFDYVPGKVDLADAEKSRQAALPPLRGRLSERLIPSAFSTLKGVNAKTIDGVLSRLSETSAGPQIQQLSSFLKRHDIRTVAINSRQLSGGKASFQIAEQVAEYLDVPRQQVLSRFTVRSRAKPEGFTSRHFNHVVLKGTNSHNLAKLDVERLIESVRKIVLDGIRNTGRYDWPGGVKRWHGFYQALDEFGNDNASRFLTWLHEISHQIHYKAGLPSRPTAEFLTYYGNTNDLEWFAEHFSAYILVRDELNAAWPDVVEYFDEILNRVK